MPREGQERIPLFSKLLHSKVQRPHLLEILFPSRGAAFYVIASTLLPVAIRGHRSSPPQAILPVAETITTKGSDPTKISIWEVYVMEPAYWKQPSRPAAVLLCTRTTVGLPITRTSHCYYVYFIVKQEARSFFILYM